MSRSPRIYNACLALLIALLSQSAQAEDAMVPEDCENASSLLRFETELGDIQIEFFADAAPDTVPQIVAAALGGDAQAGNYDGIEFDFTKPRGEIRTAGPRSQTVFTTRIDAGALGLHEYGPRDPGAAMDVLQQELLVALSKHKGGGALTPQLQQWLKTWYETYDPEFLVGATRKDINEALGFVYSDGLASRPVTRGAVALVPSSKTAASSRLSIALRDLPQRTGQWMVIGRVVAGLDIAERISLAPLIQPRDAKTIFHIPSDPVAIEAVTLACESQIVAHHISQGGN